MELLSIATDRGIELISSKIKKQIQSCQWEGILIEEETTFSEPMYEIQYRVEESSLQGHPLKEFIHLFKYSVANGIAEYILCYEETRLIWELIGREFYYFNEREQMEIQRKAQDILQEESHYGLMAHRAAHSRKGRLIQALMDYFNGESRLNLQGFITFRLREYRNELEEAVERAIEDFLFDKEYNDFIKLLKYLVDIQESKAGIVHLIMGPDHRYRLYDEGFHLIDNEYLREIAKELIEHHYLSYEDLLMSALITMAPTEIMIHQGNAPDGVKMIETIHRVFASKVKLCNGCKLCSIENHVKEDS